MRPKHNENNLVIVDAERVVAIKITRRIGTVLLV